MKKQGLLKLLVGALPFLLTLSCTNDAPITIVWDDSDNSLHSGDSQSDTYSLVVSARSSRNNDLATRATLDLTTQPYIYFWDIGEQIKLTIVPAGATSDISPIASLDRITLTSTNTERTTHTNFEGELSADIYGALQSSPTFDYYACYANGLTVNDDNFPNTISFYLPDSYSAIVPNRFNVAKTPLIGVVQNEAPNLVFASEFLGDDYADEKGGIHLTFDRHTTSYAAIEFDESMFTQGVSVTSLTITIGTESTADTWISGTYTYNIATGGGSFTEASNIISISNINIGNGERLYIPMPAKTLTDFRFDYTLSSGTTGSVSSSDNVYVTFDTGKIHLIHLTPKRIITDDGIILETPCGTIEVRSTNEILSANTNEYLTTGNGLMGALGDQINWYDPAIGGPAIIKGEPPYYCERKYGEGWRFMDACETISFLQLFDQVYRVWHSNTWVGYSFGLPRQSVEARQQAQELLGKITGYDMSGFTPTDSNYGDTFGDEKLGMVDQFFTPGNILEIEANYNGAWPFAASPEDNHGETWFPLEAITQIKAYWDPAYIDINQAENSESILFSRFVRYDHQSTVSRCVRNVK
jgi:hypothetical protein